ncbi:hypothetical protein [Brenneria izbisi]|uniref:Uncharacterized protein n=1 Tax=Brenneria izbisi TaxID=2939450 RepID=A0AA41XV74_9GAMM|nr:hypothetical protein [Brenneria izbisi]MCV9877498.1 hypothetical protein [Brenneria izbisi]MCV9880936.1 hypothetical protein [Brenneria izbisi]
MKGIVSFAEYECKGQRQLALIDINGVEIHFKTENNIYLLLNESRLTSENIFSYINTSFEKVEPPPLGAKVTYCLPAQPCSSSQGMVSGFGLAHLNKVSPDKLNDAGKLDGYPSWFFKGFANSLKMNDEVIKLSEAAVSVCEEAEIVLIYYINAESLPIYLGFTFGNDLTDIGQIRGNPSHLSYGKLADSAIHPFIFLAPPPAKIIGDVSIYRDNEKIWSRDIINGSEVLAYPVEKMMSKLWMHHSLCVPGMVHYVYIGADKNSIDFGVKIKNNDKVNIEFPDYNVLISNSIALHGGA